jgi:hypothetical protein
LRRRGAEGDGHERLAVFHAERVGAIVIAEARAVGEVAGDGRVGDRLGHLDVERVAPLLVLDVVAARAGRGA